MSETVTRPARRCLLYRHYDEDGVLLYVGIARDPSHRTLQHIDASRWVAFAVRMDGVWYASRAAAEAAESDAIRDEHPIFNWHQLSWSVAKERRESYERTHVPVEVPGVEVKARPTRAMVAQGIRDQITSGELPLGSTIGTIKEVASSWSLGLDSTIRVFSELIEQGWLERLVPRGPCTVTRSLPPRPLDRTELEQMRRDQPSQREAVMRHVRELIDAGKFNPGDRLPSLNRLADMLSVSARTAQHAMERLRAEGIVTARRGDGTFVADRKSSPPATEQAS